MLDDHANLNCPAALAGILADTGTLGFAMASEPLTGCLLRTLAAGKPAGQVLELGTGTGLGAAWLLDGMDTASRLVTIDNDDALVAITRKHLANDARATFLTCDAAEFIAGRQGMQFDLVFADTWAGKFTHLPEALALVKPGGLYVIDDLLPQASWPAEHASRVPPLIESLERRPDFAVTRLNWASGLIIAARRVSTRAI